MDKPYLNTILNREGQLYCVKDSAFDELMEELRIHVGGHWKDVARQGRMSTRHLRHLRSHKYRTAQLTVMDRLLSRLGVPHKVAQLEWLTPEQLVERGVWKPAATHNLMVGPPDRWRAQRKAEEQADQTSGKNSGRVKGKQP
jgi:hypothetical protein